jgi:hypothetical protein
MSETPKHMDSVVLAYSSLDAALGKTIDAQHVSGHKDGSPMETLNNSSLFHMQDEQHQQ